MWLSEEEIVAAVLSFDGDQITQATMSALRQGRDPVKILDDLTRALGIVGKKFENGEYFLVHLVAAAVPVQKVIKEILEPEMFDKDEQRKSLGTVVLGTVEGDIHDIGKNIVGAMLFASGFEVHDLGTDVPAERFVAKAREVKASLVGGSALLSTTVPKQRTIVDEIVAAGLRDQVKLIFGGAAVSEDWVKKIGGDGFASSAPEAVSVAKKLLKIEE